MAGEGGHEGIDQRALSNFGKMRILILSTTAIITGLVAALIAKW